MVRYAFGGNRFINCSVPLAFEGRYFIVEPGDPDPLVSVVLEYQGKPIFEVSKNEPVANPLTIVSKTPPGIVTVDERQTGRFLYKVRPGSETSIAFRTIKGEELSASVTDREIRVGGVTLKNNVFDGVRAGVVVDEHGNFSIGAAIPKVLREWFKQES